MRYWGILLAKLVGAGAVLYAIWLGLWSWYTPSEVVRRFGHSPFATDLTWTTLMFFYNLLCQGVLFLIVWDQRYRCRTCGRRLRMPISTGRYAQMLLFGRPHTEYICVYGHGTLKVPDLHTVGGHEPTNWQPHDDIWKELYSLHDAEKKN
jgi:hypothetical protein